MHPTQGKNRGGSRTPRPGGAIPAPVSGGRFHPAHHASKTGRRFSGVRLCKVLGYAVRFAPVGPVDSEVGSPTQMGVFDMETQR